ncbi:MAG TPA: penicillin-binding protein 2 [Actinomycetota bacterium]|nr:penicillin-binding protein 2 [Actinomycetota bacterium]
MSPSANNVSPIRLTVVNLLVLTLLATLFGRLWYLQVLAGNQAQALAERTSIRFVYEQAPRGFIFDRAGKTLARNRTALTVALDVSAVPAQRRDQVISDLAAALHMKRSEVREIFDDKRIGPHTPRPIALDVDKDIVVYLQEHAEQFPGVRHVEIPVREYPYGAVASHAIGHIGEINEEELEAEEDRRDEAVARGQSSREYRPGDLIGKVGVERQYEDWLAGKVGVRKIAVDVRGERVQDFGYQAPERGWDAILTIDAGLQLAAEDALERGVETARGLTDPDSGKKFKAPAGAVVAMDPRNGEILALASNPDFDPNLFVGSAPRGELAKLNAPDSNMPFLNRAIAEAVPPGSTFKPLTAAAAWSVDPSVANRTFQCPGYLKVGTRTFRDWKPGGHGTVGLSRSLAESCDIVYYTLGVELDQRRRELREEDLQDVARRFGLGRRAGIDLRGEAQGLVPDAEWKWNRFSYAQTYDRRWFPGDAANLAIGQGFLQMTPLQLAIAYASIANGGTVYRPHVLKCLAQLNVSRPTVVDEACRAGLVPKAASPKVMGRVEIPPGAFTAIEQAMSGTVRDEGTAAGAFTGFPLDRVFVAGKTGTAQMKPKQPFSWFAAIGKAGGREIVVVALVEEAGTGSQIAAPIVRRVMDQHFGVAQASGFEAGVRAD